MSTNKQRLIMAEADREAFEKLAEHGAESEAQTLSMSLSAMAIPLRLLNNQSVIIADGSELTRIIYRKCIHGEPGHTLMGGIIDPVWNSLPIAREYAKEDDKTVTEFKEDADRKAHENAKAQRAACARAAREKLRRAFVGAYNILYNVDKYQSALHAERIATFRAALAHKLGLNVSDVKVKNSWWSFSYDVKIVDGAIDITLNGREPDELKITANTEKQIVNSIGRGDTKRFSFNLTAALKLPNGKAGKKPPANSASSSGSETVVAPIKSVSQLTAATEQLEVKTDMQRESAIFSAMGLLLKARASGAILPYMLDAYKIVTAKGYKPNGGISREHAMIQAAEQQRNIAIKNARDEASDRIAELEQQLRKTAQRALTAERALKALKIEVENKAKAQDNKAKAA